MRRKGLPEATTYLDTGCSVQPNCLSCTLIACRFDRHLNSQRVDEKVAMLRALLSGSLCPDILSLSHSLGVSRRQTFRLLQRARETAARKMLEDRP